MINVLVCCSYEVRLDLFLLSYQIFVIQGVYWKQVARKKTLSNMLTTSLVLSLFHIPTGGRDVASDGKNHESSRD